MYDISKRYINLGRDRIWLVLVFILLPGVVSSAIVINSAGMVIFGLLLFIYLEQKFPEPFIIILLLVYSIIDIGFAYLFLGLFFYYILAKRKYLVLYSIFLYSLTSYLYGFGASGSPTGHFLDTIGIYSAVFSPIIFIYICYILHRRYMTGKIDLIWYIAVTGLILSLALSFRQRIAIEHFAPYLIISLPLVAQSFISSYKVRLKIFRKGYKLIFVSSFVILIFNSIIVSFNKELYNFIDEPKNHFAYNMHVAKDLSRELRIKGINCVETNANMQKRLKFYNISYCKKNVLRESNNSENNTSFVTISYKNKTLYRANVTKINTL
ncbi:hypothetical protein [Sulfurimonas sp.]|uniref:hypothetical protein n=1 Tax=Sulfurimonas sp. TaxID=2022749 RepID=UPI0025FEBC6E|nr:hypothetical protein [Sulfurimonas sp.]